MLLAYDKVCLSDVLSKWKQGIADGDVVISHNPLEKLENPYLPFVGKRTIFADSSLIKFCFELFVLISINFLKHCMYTYLANSQPLNFEYRCI